MSTSNHHLTLSKIWIYPIKSLGGISLTAARVLEKGLQYDRRWMLVDNAGVFMTQRIHPKMALLKLALDHGHIFITNQINGDQLSFFVETSPIGDPIRATIWEDLVDVIEVDPMFSEWFSRQLNFDCRLVSFPENHSRPVDPRFKINDEHVSLADAYPFLIIGQSSFDDLNNRLAEKIDINRFRPNFVFTGGEPYEEDAWRDFSIGDNRFVGVKNCGRCALITVNQETAEKGVEPLQTLSIYRKRENKVLFGQNLVALDFGNVSVGDEIILS
jgi:uncharacterized protein YcbX